MQCNCNKLAVKRTSGKPGHNLGKEYFTCCSNSCNFFSWVGAIVPPHRNQTQVKSPKKLAANAVEVRLSIVQFEENPLRVWFATSHGPSSKLTTYYNSLPKDVRRFDDKVRNWNFDFIKLYDQFVNQLQSDAFNFVELQELPKFLVNGIKKYVNKRINDLLIVAGENFRNGLSNQSDGELVLNIENSLMDTLLPFQLEGIKFVIKHGGKALIGDEMGSGKTIQAIGVMQHYRQHWPVLLLMPPTLVDQWKNELMTWCKELLTEKDICCVGKGKDSVSGKIVILPYTLVDKMISNNTITPEQFGIVIADESHRIKTGAAKMTQGAMLFLKRATISLCLSGIPTTLMEITYNTQISTTALTEMTYNISLFIQL